MADVICFGNAVADVLVRHVRRLPPVDQTDVLEDAVLQLGGNAAIMAMALRRLGISCSIVTRIGRDPLGRVLRESLAGGGVDTARLVEDGATATSTSVGMVRKGGGRSFFHYIGATANLGEGDVPWETAGGARVFCLVSFFIAPRIDGRAAARMLRRARSLGLLTCLDVCWDPSGRWMEVLRPCLPHVDLFVPNLTEGRRLAGRRHPPAVARVLADAGARAVVLKMGADGCYLWTEGRGTQVPGYAVQAVDTTGAGDCFNAGLLAARLRGWPLLEACRFGNAVGARSVTAMGGTAGVRSFEETLRFAGLREP